MTCSICGEKTIPGVVCCDELMADLDEPTEIRGCD